MAGPVACDPPPPADDVDKQGFQYRFSGGAGPFPPHPAPNLKTLQLHIMIHWDNTPGTAGLRVAQAAVTERWP